MIAEQPLEIDLDALGLLAKEAGALALSFFGKVAAQYKTDRSLVSEADYAVENFLIERLAVWFPHTAILGEEHGRNQIISNHLWVLDPIDGTAAYLSHFPVWGVSIGYMFQNVPVAGVFYLPVTNDLFLAHRQLARWNDSILSKPLPHAIHAKSLLLVPSDTHRKYTISFSGKTRSFGSVAAHICYVAAGKAVGAVLGKVNLWDIAGVLPILSAAGGGIYTLAGARLDIGTLLQNNKAQQPLLAAPEWYIKDLVKVVSLNHQFP